jgi:hypothetical protein
MTRAQEIKLLFRRQINLGRLQITRAYQGSGIKRGITYIHVTAPIPLNSKYDKYIFCTSSEGKETADRCKMCDKEIKNIKQELLKILSNNNIDNNNVEFLITLRRVYLYTIDSI